MPSTCLLTREFIFQEDGCRYRYKVGRDLISIEKRKKISVCTKITAEKYFGRILYRKTWKMGNPVEKKKYCTSLREGQIGSIVKGNTL